MGDLKSLDCGWSWKENKLFEQDPNRWEAVAALVGGEKSAEEVSRHYMVLMEDLQFIEGGFMDNELDLEDDHNHKLILQVACPQCIYWTDEDHDLLVQLNIS